MAEHSITNFNGDGGEHSQAEKRRVEGHRSSEGTKRVTPKELVSSNAWLRLANSNDTRGGQDFSISYILKARNIRGHIKIQHVMHKPS